MSALDGLGIGAAVGLALCAIAAPLWWRLAAPRVGGVAESYGSTGIPTTALDQIDRDTALALLARWRAMTTGNTSRIAVLSMGGKTEPIARQVAAWLSSLPVGRAASETLVIAVDWPSPEDLLDPEALRSDVLALLVPAEMRVGELIERTTVLTDAGHRPDWALLVDSPRKTRQALDRASPV